MFGSLAPRTRAEMWLFLVLLWCSSVAGRGERLSIVRDNSQFSRLIRGEIPCLPLWEFIGNVLILPAVLTVKRGSMARIDENSRLSGNNRDFAPTAVTKP